MLWWTGRCLALALSMKRELTIFFIVLVHRLYILSVNVRKWKNAHYKMDHVHVHPKADRLHCPCLSPSTCSPVFQPSVALNRTK